jgi:hypothetical protein
MAHRRRPPRAVRSAGERKGECHRARVALSSRPVMQRVREAPPAPTEERLPSVEAMPPVPLEADTLLARMRVLNEPGVTPDEVDRFLAGLSAHGPPGEPPRVRADVMLDILEDPRLCRLTGTDGRRVGVAALEALLGLGYPYALEVTPEMLALARGPEAQPFRLPGHLRAGLGLAFINVLLPVGTHALEALDSHPSADALAGVTPGESPLDAGSHLPLLVLLILGPPMVSALAALLGFRPLQRVFNAVQWVLGLLGVFLGLNGHLGGLPVDSGDRILSLAVGVLTLVTALCLRPREEPEP